MATIHTAWDQVSANIFKTYLVMALFTVFVFAVVYIFARAWGLGNFGGLGLAGFALILAGISNIASYYYSDKIVLAVSNAKPLKKENNLQLYRLVENLCIASGLPLPKIYTIDDSAPNAFATGRDKNHAAIAFTTGILDKLNKTELEGVAAHELSHIGNRDTLLMSVVAILVGTIAILADWFLRSLWYRGSDREERNNGAIFMALALLAAILAPLIATLIQLAISRRRELLADASGVLITRYPQGLESALFKISQDKEPLEVANRGTAHLYIVNPLKGSEAVGFLAGLFNTHPPIEVRIKALKQMEGQA